jgi:hypothetical protein
LNDRALHKTIRETIQREFRACDLLMVPEVVTGVSPNDLDAEGEVLSSLLSGDIEHGELVGLCAFHFYAHLHSLVFSAIVRGGLRNVGAELRRMGAPKRALDAAFEIRDQTPYSSRERVQRSAQRIIELYERRELLVRLRQVCVELGSGALSSASAVQRLEALSRRAPCSARKVSAAPPALNTAGAGNRSR